MRERLGVPLTTLDETPELDMTVDGADEIGPDLTLIKGGGGALLREKIVAAASARMVVIADESKWVQDARPLSAADRGHAVRLGRDPAGGRGRGRRRRIARAATVLRQGKDGHAFVTDGGHWILDAALDRIADAESAGRPAVVHPWRRRARSLYRARASRHTRWPCRRSRRGAVVTANGPGSQGVTSP